MKKFLDIHSFDFNKFIGREIENVTILKELGRGNRGVVFIGFQKSLKRKVAVKILPKACATTEEQREQFRDEAEIVAILSHPNIITIFEMGEEDDFYFQAMQLITGSDLDKIISMYQRYPIPSKRLIPFKKALELIIQTLDGLAYAHEEGVIHQDIKPSNVLIEKRTQRPLIADFGIAKAANIESHETEGVITGSPVYMSPEQALGKETDNRSDIYSTGILFLKMLTGVLPVRKESAEEILFRKINQPDSFLNRPLTEASPYINEELERIILRSIEVDVENRYQDCDTFKNDLIRFRDRLRSH